MFNMQKKYIGVINAYGVLCHVSRLDNGKMWYCLMTIPEIGEYDSYAESRNDIEKLTLYRTGGETLL